MAGVGMYHLERDAQPEVFATVYDGLWWAVVTLTSVGYGDIQPVTAGGRILATVAMFAGIGVIGAAFGIMADALRETSAGEGAAQGGWGRGSSRATPTEVLRLASDGARVVREYSAGAGCVEPPAPTAVANIPRRTPQSLVGGPGVH